MFPGLSDAALAQFRGVYFHLASESEHSVLLDSCGLAGKTGGLYVMGFEALAIRRFENGILRDEAGLQTPIADAQALWRQLFPESAAASDVPFGFHQGWIGTLGYDLSSLLEPAVAPDKRIAPRETANPFGVLYWVCFRHRILWEPAAARLEILSDDPAWVTRVRALLSGPMPALPEMALPDTSAMQSSFTQPAFEAAVATLQDAIRQGEIYQANLSIRYAVPDIPAEALPGLYLKLVARNPSPFSGIFRTPEGWLLSNSPERLVKRDAQFHRLETRPIAGTRGRGASADEEARIARTLHENVKEQAEHAMLVDLARNDLGRLCAAGSVTVTEAGVLERYSHVTHLVSQVEGAERPELSVSAIIEALFPAGTITGCPKIRCIQLLGTLEPVSRGLYTGGFGYVDDSGHADWNILIRSLFYDVRTRELSFHAGAGIVADSVPAWEYRECLRKAAVIKGVLAS